MAWRQVPPQRASSPYRRVPPRPSMWQQVPPMGPAGAAHRPQMDDGTDNTFPNLGPSTPPGQAIDMSTGLPMTVPQPPQAAQRPRFPMPGNGMGELLGQPQQHDPRQAWYIVMNDLAQKLMQGGHPYHPVGQAQGPHLGQDVLAGGPNWETGQPNLRVPHQLEGRGSVKLPEGGSNANLQGLRRKFMQHVMLGGRRGGRILAG